MGRTCSIHVTGKKYKIAFIKHERRDHMEDLGVSQRIVLKSIMKT
jgi:hypothetical protein